MRPSDYLVPGLCAALSTLLLASCGGVGATTTSQTPSTTYQLSVLAPTSGAGTITSAPSGINCPSTCSASFSQGTQVTLTETAGTNYVFSGWSGGCSGANSCSVVMTKAVSVTPAFTEEFALTVTATGAGTITSNPAGISCSNATCTATFPQNTQVTLAETAGSSYYFVGWGGSCSGSTTCSVTVTGAENVTANFTTGNVLTVALAGVGTGSVTSSPAGINCSAGTCSASFAPGTEVVLSPTAGSNNVFAAWSGGCTGSAACTVTLSAPVSVTASFGLTLQSLNHIILFAQENRSFDHYFGYMRQYWANNGVPDQSFDGLPQFNPVSGIAPLQGPVPSVPGCDPTNPNGTDVCTPDASNPVASFHMASVCTEEISPFWNEAHLDWNDSFLYPNTITPLLDGFVEAAANDARQYTAGTVNDINGYRSMGYFQDTDLNYYYAMATNFATSDRWFAPVMSRTQLNRMYLLAATSAGHAYPLSPSNAPNGALTNTTIFEALQDAGITWKIYVNPQGTGCSSASSNFNSCLANISYISMFTFEQTIQASYLQNVAPISQFTTDAQNGTLPQVALIEPASNAGLDEHPTDSDTEGGVNIQAGAAYAASLINALMSSPSWKDSALIFTYDEPGGFYDHVSPQPATPPGSNLYPTDLQPSDACDGANATSGVCSFAMTGYRVPVIVISPFARKNFVSHTVRDTTAVLNLIEERFSIPALTARDASWSTTTPIATMDEFFDFVNEPWATPPSPPAQNNPNNNCSLAAPNPSAP